MFQTQNLSGDKISLEFKDDQLIYNGTPFSWSLNQKNNTTYLISKDHKNFRAEILKIDRQQKSATIKINKSIFDIQLKDKMDMLLEEMGIDNIDVNQANDLKAPMPGLILEVFVENDQDVKKGDQLLILEAMKMENVLKAPGDGKIKSVEIAKSDSVEKGQILIKF